jgi:methyl-accepting chemotaxis protein
LSFFNLTIKSRLYFGFAAIVLFGLALSVFSGWQFMGVESDVATMGALSNGAVRAREISEHIQAVRRALLQYMHDGDQAAFKESADRGAKAMELLKQAAAAAAGRPDRLAAYQGLQKSVEQLAAKRDALGKAVARKEAGREALFAGGDEFTAASQKLVQAARDTGDPGMTRGAANVETAVLSTRIASWQFLATEDPKGVDAFNANAQKAWREMAGLEQMDLPVEVGALVAPVQAALTNYIAAFEKTSTSLFKAEDLYAKEVAPLASAISETVDAVTAAQKEELEADETRTGETIAGTITVQEIVATLTVLLGGLAAFLIARGISGPLLKMGGAMKELASGNLEVTIPAQDKRDEIGEMAKAVLVFQEAAVENARLEREAAEHRAQAEGDRARNEQAQREAIEHERAVVASSIGSALSKLAAKDLTYRMPTDIPDAYRKLQADFNAAIAQLEEAMRSVTGSAHAIHSGTQEISTASDDLSRRTEQQAASLEETAAALDEITATVKKSAEGAKHARQVVAAADEDAKKSAIVVREAVAAMDAIAKSAQQISQIIGVIDEIAFQTNLLALNAGVEAARAGDAGRGFAVVASEVRALAQRSAEAAKEIKGLISTSTTQVDHGVKLVAETGQSLERIMAQVTEINDVVGAIAAGAQEQATGLQQVNTAINQMDQATQQNATMVEESTAASHSLSQETNQLSGLVGQFQVGRPGGADAQRAQLQKAAPHAFRQPAKVPASAKTEPRAAASVPRKEAPRPMRAASRAVANGAPVADDAGDWKEF